MKIYLQIYAVSRPFARQKKKRKPNSPCLRPWDRDPQFVQKMPGLPGVYLIISDPVGSCWVMLGHVSSSTEWNIMLHPFAWLLGLLGMLLGQLFYSVRDLASLESNKVWPAHFPLQRSKGFHSGTQMDNTACHSLWIRSPWSLQVFAEVRCGGACCRPINSFHRDKHHSFTPLTWPCCIWKVVPTGTGHAVLQEHIRHSRVRFASKETNRELFNSTMAKNQTGALNWNYF